MLFEKIPLDSEDYYSFVKIYEQSFPDNERRYTSSTRKLLENDYYNLYGVKNKNIFEGFSLLYRGSDFYLHDYTAVRKESTGHGIGSFIMEELAKIKDMISLHEVQLDTPPY